MNPSEEKTSKLNYRAANEPVANDWPWAWPGYVRVNSLNIVASPSPRLTTSMLMDLAVRTGTGKWIDGSSGNPTREPIVALVTNDPTFAEKAFKRSGGKVEDLTIVSGFDFTDRAFEELIDGEAGFASMTVIDIPPNKVNIAEHAQRVMHNAGLICSGDQMVYMNVPLAVRSLPRLRTVGSPVWLDTADGGIAITEAAGGVYRVRNLKGPREFAYRETDSGLVLATLEQRLTCREWLLKQFEGGPVLKDEILARAVRDGLNPDSIPVTASRMGIRTRQLWDLPDTGD
jgi:hypothetical protein